MKKIAFLVHQYGNEIVGGAEGYTKTLAEYLSKNYETTVYTTTSIDYNTWEPYYQAGEEFLNGVHIKRYDVLRQRNMEQFVPLCNVLSEKMAQGISTTLQEDFRWLESEGPYCPQLVDDVVLNKEEYDLIVVVTYIYYIAASVIPKIKDKCLFISTAHDEPWINLSVYNEIFNSPACFGFLTEAEKELVHNKFNNAHIPYEILGSGISVPKETNENRFREKFGVLGDYLIYVGRIDESKGCKELCDYFIEYKQKNNIDLKLVLVGKGAMQIPDRTDIIATGFVTEEEKYDAISGALAMATPSKYESLCIALLEAMALKVPVIANEKCQVLKQHCLMSNAGLYYDNSVEFGRIVNYYLEHKTERLEMGNNGCEYIRKNYSWEVVENKIEKIILNLNKECKKSENQDAYKYKVILDEDNDKVMPVYKDAITVITAADNNYAEYAGVTINSIISNKDQEDNYDILVFTNDITDENIEKILSLKTNNVSIRFIYVNKIMDNIKINISNNYNIVTYYRLLLQRIMSNYDKLIYMDSDIIINSNLRQLWDIDINGYLLGGTYDSLIAAWQSYDSGMQAYFEAIETNIVGQYMQAGIMIMNIRELNETFEPDYLLENASIKRYIFADQDLLNIACKGKIKYIDQAWDVLNLSNEARQLCYDYLPSKNKEEFMYAEDNPKAVHFVEQSFPIKSDGRKYGNLYWKYVYYTPFYSSLLLKKNDNKIIDVNKNMNLFSSKAKRKVRKLESGLKVNDKKIETNNIVLKSGEVLSGPSIFLSSGTYKLTWHFASRKKINGTLKFTAGAGNIVLYEINDIQSKGQFVLNLNRNYADCEIVFENIINTDIVVKKLRIDTIEGK